MKATEIRELKSEEIRQRITEEEEEYRHLHFQHAVAALPNPSLLREKRRFIARLKTILHEKGEAA